MLCEGGPSSVCQTEKSPLSGSAAAYSLKVLGADPATAIALGMLAGITAGAAGASADLLNDRKSGYLLGANPRRQFLAQAAGV